MDEAMRRMLLRAREAAAVLAGSDTGSRNRALAHMADALEARAAEILAANEADMAAAAATLSPVMLDRLRLDGARIGGMAGGIRALISLPDPIGVVDEESVRPNGLRIRRVSVPLGVVAMIYESRPNVTADAAALCLKSGNACILRGGREAFASAKAILGVLRRAIEECGLPGDCLNMPEDPSRASAEALMNAVGYVDVLIPRGGAGLIRACTENARVPCIQTGTGICHIYVDREADPDMACRIVENAKASRPSVCNAAEVCLVHRDIAPRFLPMLRRCLCDDRAAAGKVPVSLRLDERAAALIPGEAAGPQDFDTEFLDYTLAVGVVDDVDAAIAHIAAHSTHHSESIVTENAAAAERFLRAVDSAAVYHNASTRFTDGGEFGLGCEIGISTQKLHVRGPMGLRALTSYKYIVEGSGQTR